MCLSEHNPFVFAYWNYVHRSVKLTAWNTIQNCDFVTFGAKITGIICDNFSEVLPVLC